MSFLRPRIQQKLDGMVARVQELLAQSADPKLLERPERLASLHKELGTSTPIVQRYQAFTRLVQQLEENRTLVLGPDRELAELAAAEVPEQEAKAKVEAETLIDLLLADQGDDRRDCIVEIRAGTGGEEAALFARDLCTIYQRYATRRGWAFEPMHSTPAEQGGFKEIVFSLRGQSVFYAMQFESGGHRVQRVPETEAKGRVHTSAATVAVLPKLEMEDVDIRKEDIRTDTFRASGAGGQHVNRTESGVRFTHLPTGIVAESTESRSQHKNREIAMGRLIQQIKDAQVQQHQSGIAAARRTLVGSGDRSEKIRTYNWPQNRVTDHRLEGDNKNFNLDRIVEGELAELIEALVIADNAEKLRAEQAD